MMGYADPFGVWPFPPDWPVSPDGAPLIKGEEPAIAQVLASRKAAYENGDGASAGNISYAEAKMRSDAMKEQASGD
jgi:hypothetical protein